MKQMADPRFARAIEFMQRDPEGCKSYYMKHDPEFFKEFIEFFRQNMQRIAGHLEKKEVPEPNLTERKSPEDIKMQSILERFVPLFNKFNIIQMLFQTGSERSNIEPSHC